MLCPYFLTLLAYDLWIILTLQGRRILQWETPKLQASTQGKTSVEKKVSFYTQYSRYSRKDFAISIIFGSVRTSGNKNHFKEKLCCSKLTSGHWLLSTQSASWSAESEDLLKDQRNKMSNMLLWASKRWERQRWRMERRRVSMGMEWVWNVIEYTSRLWKRELSVQNWKLRINVSSLYFQSYSMPYCVL